MRNFVEACGGRRFLLCVGCGIATTALTAFGKIGGEVYATVIIATVGAYITGNTFQKVRTHDSDARYKSTV
jgi:L-lactate utilization protein LutB